MASEKRSPAPIAGLNRSKKLIKRGQASGVYLAYDADLDILLDVKALCKETDTPLNLTKTKRELAELCGIEVDCAVCVIPKDI